MRKIMRYLSALALISICLAAGGTAVFAEFGSGAAVIAKEVTLVKSGLRGRPLSFRAADFTSALCISDFDTVTVRSIPSSTEGSLVLSGRRVGEGKTVRRRQLDSLVFVPASKEVERCSFTFSVDGGSGEEIECVLKFTDRVNYAPSAESPSRLTTQEGISVYSSFRGTDPEGDELSYTVISYPKYGHVTRGDGADFCYTPNASYTGGDEFSYVVRDEFGNYSTPVSIKISVTDRMCDTVYADMTDRREYGAAVAMTAMSVMGGRVIGDGVYFIPDEELSRAEFVAMAMKCAGIRPDTTVCYTDFEDDADIPDALRPYIATAARIGIVSGDFEDGGLFFKPTEALTRYEAARIISEVMGFSDSEEETVYGETDTVPIWARASVSAMRTLGIYGDEDVTECITRANAAEYLYRMISVMAN